MKKINLVLFVLAGWIGIITSCHKPDFPYKKLCQITTIIDSTPNYGFQYHYLYNQKRLLDSMSAGPTFNPDGALTLKMEYDYLNRPVIIRDNYNGVFKYVYQNGRIVRQDELRADNLYHPLYTYVLDWRGRIIERSSASQVIRWEYEGASANFKRRLYFGLSDPRPELIYEYKYDNKVNPGMTWPNTTINPFSFQLMDMPQQFEPIPQNNFVHENVQGRNGDGTYFRFRQTFFNYEYDDVYPIKRTVRYLQYNPNDNQVRETTGLSLYYYDCKNDAH